MYQKKTQLWTSNEWRYSDSDGGGTRVDSGRILTAMHHTPSAWIYLMMCDTSYTISIVLRRAMRLQLRGIFRYDIPKIYHLAVMW